MKTSQQHISRLESPGYEGHSLANLRRVARALKVRVRVVFESEDANGKRDAARIAVPRGAKRRTTRRS
jgi:hypothetical protein